MLLQKDSLELWRKKLINIWLQYQYIDKLDDILDIYNYTYNRTFKMKPIDVELSWHIDHSIENNDKDPKSKVGKEDFVIKKVKNTVTWTYVINEEIVGTFYEKELEKNETEFKVEK